MTLKVSKLVPVAIIMGIFVLLTSGPLQAKTSVNVAIIGGPSVRNGGVLPTSGTDLSGITFTSLAPSAVTSAALAPFDTVVLNVASNGIYCDMGVYLPAQARIDIRDFVHSGGKLIIYDSECSPQDYSWLPYPFTTSNPGAQGANGTLTIVEENVLSSNDSSSPYYINASYLSTSTDAVGDMNVMTTFDPNWCLDMSGTNVLGVTGPVHTYARYGFGLIIYNGLDVDMISYGTNALRKIWVQELKAAFDPSPISDLPCGNTVVGINLSPATATNLAGTSHTVTAKIEDLLGNPVTGVVVTFTVISGPNAGTTGTCSANADCSTDSNGEVSFTYASNGTVGEDEIQAQFTDNAGLVILSQVVKKTWEVQVGTCDVNGDLVIDSNDIRAILAARWQPASGPTDPRDADHDGMITPMDAKICIQRCTNLNCAPSPP